jgi:glutathione S-transferase
VLREAGISFDLVSVDWQTRRATDGAGLDEITSKGYVPVLVLDNGEALTENAVLLEYIADIQRNAPLAPPAGTLERYRVSEWLSYISTELHKPYSLLFLPDASEDMKTHARDALKKRIGWAASQLGSMPYLLGEHFSIADAYLFVVLAWSPHVGYDLSPWPNLLAFQERVGARPRVVEAMQAEGLLK